jgi:hypothetical protein
MENPANWSGHFMRSAFMIPIIKIMIGQSSHEIKAVGGMSALVDTRGSFEL